jgi:hypothetical protein
MRHWLPEAKLFALRLLLASEWLFSIKQLLGVMLPSIGGNCVDPSISSKELRRVT